MQGIFDMFGLAVGTGSPIMQSGAAEQQAAYNNLLAEMTNAYRPVCKLLPAGIEWEQTGGKTCRVTIRREPEWVPDYGAVSYKMLNAAPRDALSAAGYPRSNARG